MGKKSAVPILNSQTPVQSAIQPHLQVSCFNFCIDFETMYQDFAILGTVTLMITFMALHHCVADPPSAPSMLGTNIDPVNKYHERGILNAKPGVATPSS